MNAMKSMSEDMHMSETGRQVETKMTLRRSPALWIAIGVAVVVVGGVGWYVFRPELLFVNQKVNEEFPQGASAKNTANNGGPRSIASGMFHNGAHDTKGKAALYQLADGKRVLRLTDFETSNGPDVHVYLVAATDATDNETVKSAGYIDLGSLKGNVGDQNYDVPADVDLDSHRAVTIWCARFAVNFGTAPLK